MREKTAERNEPILTDAEPKFLVRQEKLAVRCEICHQVDLFNPETGHCARCARVTPPSLPEYPQPVQDETVQTQPPQHSSPGTGVGVALAVAILMYGIVQVFNLIRETIPPEWVERMAKALLNPEILVLAGMAVLLGLPLWKLYRRQKLANRENV